MCWVVFPHSHQHAQSQVEVVDDVSIEVDIVTGLKQLNPAAMCDTSIIVHGQHFCTVHNGPHALELIAADETAMLSLHEDLPITEELFQEIVEALRAIVREKRQGMEPLVNFEAW